VLLYLREMQRAVEASRQPWPQIVGALEAAPPTSVLGEVLMWPYERFAIIIGRSITRVRAAQLAVVIELYRRQYGQLPDSLNDLGSDYVETIPADPFDGDRLKYRSDGRSVFIYGVGTNRQDDDGDIDVRSLGTREEESPDIGFRLRLPPELD
jgi:hypothetical protein